MTGEPAQVTIYSDGACLGNPGPGGWAALLISANQRKEISGGEADTTNNRMELMAAIQALQALKRPCRVELYTDSTYLLKGVTEWLPGWKKRGWKRKEGALANSDLWQALDGLLSRQKVSWHWLRGHAGDLHNEYVDRLANTAAQQAARTKLKV